MTLQDRPSPPQTAVASPAPAFPASARRALRAYANADDKTRARLARANGRYRIVKGVPKIRHWTRANDTLGDALTASARIWTEHWGAADREAREKLYRAVAAATLRVPRPSRALRFSNSHWTLEVQAADLEAQAAVAALVLRDSGAPLPDALFDRLVAAWRKVGLPL